MTKCEAAEGREKRGGVREGKAQVYVGDMSRVLAGNDETWAKHGAGCCALSSKVTNYFFFSGRRNCRKAWRLSVGHACRERGGRRGVNYSSDRQGRGAGGLCDAEGWELRTKRNSFCIKKTGT